MTGIAKISIACSVLIRRRWRVGASVAVAAPSAVSLIRGPRGTEGAARLFVWCSCLLLPVRLWTLVGLLTDGGDTLRGVVVLLLRGALLRVCVGLLLHRPHVVGDRDEVDHPEVLVTVARDHGAAVAVGEHRVERVVERGTVIEADQVLGRLHDRLALELAQPRPA